MLTRARSPIVHHSLRVLDRSHRCRRLISSTASSVELAAVCDSKPPGSSSMARDYNPTSAPFPSSPSTMSSGVPTEGEWGPLPLYSPILFASPVLPASPILPAGLVASSTVFGAPSTIFGTPASLAETTAAVEVRHKILIVALVTHLPSRGNVLRLSPSDWPSVISRICAASSSLGSMSFQAACWI